MAKKGDHKKEDVNKTKASNKKEAGIKTDKSKKPDHDTKKKQTDSKQTDKKQSGDEQSARKKIIINSQTVSDLSEHLPIKGKHKIGKRLLIAFIILICLCGLAFGLSKAGIIPITITYLEDQGLLIEFPDPAEFYRQKTHPEEYAQTDLQKEDSTAQGSSAVQGSSATAQTESGVTETGNTLLLPDGLEIPLCPTDSHDHERRVLSGFTLCYREDYEQPEWVAYTITPEKLVKETERANNFRADPQISTGSATPDDYKASGYDRGHLAPAADMAYSDATMRESFYMSNMSPQEPSFNRGIWNNLENDVRAIAAGCDCLYVITGPVLEKPASKYAHIGTNEVSVPEYYYKVLLAVTYEGTQRESVTSYAYIVPNGKTDENPSKFICTIDDVEKRTGIDFFSLLEDGLENELEAGTKPTAEIIN